MKTLFILPTFIYLVMATSLVNAAPTCSGEAMMDSVKDVLEPIITFTMKNEGLEFNAKSIKVEYRDDVKIPYTDPLAPEYNPVLAFRVTFESPSGIFSIQDRSTIHRLGFFYITRPILKQNFDGSGWVCVSQFNHSQPVDYNVGPPQLTLVRDAGKDDLTGREIVKFNYAFQEFRANSPESGTLERKSDNGTAR